MYNNKLRIEKIGNERINEFLTVLRDIAVWLESNGKEMWSLEGLERNNFLNNNKNAKLFLCYYDNEISGAFMLLDENKTWWPEVIKDDSLFLKKLGVARKHAGKGIASYIIEWVKENR